jgi:clorobiocin biosynthesis protein CloN7
MSLDRGRSLMLQKVDLRASPRTLAMPDGDHDAYGDEQMIQTTANTLRVPGASLYYEVTGAGPVLMLIGLPVDHTEFEKVVPLLADRYTVVTYDPRGFSKSAIDDPEQDTTPDLAADDVHCVLAAVTSEPAYVLGSSGGAVTALALLAAHPEQVRAIVAHEPPILELLPDAERHFAEVEDVYDTFRREGQGPAFMKFMASIDPDLDPAEMMAAQGPPTPEMIANVGRMLAHSLRPTALYHPDLAALRAVAGQIVVGVGADTIKQAANQAARALAARLDLPVVEFPGHHEGFVSDPEPFAATLVEVLQARA